MPHIVISGSLQQTFRKWAYRLINFTALELEVCKSSDVEDYMITSSCCEISRPDCNAAQSGLSFFNIELDDGNILTGKPDLFDGKNPWVSG